jgi:hypothetical protein
MYTFSVFLEDTVMSRSPMEDNPTLSPMHINFDRDWGVKASPASRMEPTEAIEQPDSAEQDYSLEPPEVVIELNNEPDIENVSEEQEEQKKPTVVVNTKPNEEKNKTTKRKTT